MMWTGWSHLIWHNFVKVAGNWIKIRSLAWIGTRNRRVKFGWKIPNRFVKIATSRQGGCFWLTLYICYLHCAQRILVIITCYGSILADVVFTVGCVTRELANSHKMLDLLLPSISPLLRYAIAWLIPVQWKLQSAHSLRANTFCHHQKFCLYLTRPFVHIAFMFSYCVILFDL